MIRRSFLPSTADQPSLQTRIRTIFAAFLTPPFSPDLESTSSNKDYVLTTIEIQTSKEIREAEEKTKKGKGKTNPTNPSFANGPPTFCAVPPIAPSALNMLPTAPSFENAGVPVPWVFWPAGAFVVISS
jgi:hypothetical protein